MKKDFYTLGIETTCDETSASVLKNGTELVSNVVYSQTDIHKKFKGVVPELASRAHSMKMASVVKQAISKLGTKPKIDVVAFASGPGLPGALLVGRVGAELLSRMYNAKLIGVNHLEGHLLACDFKEGTAKTQLTFPLIGLIVSGGHTELWIGKNYGEYKLIGRTRDDAVGEAFDKVAKLLDLGYPGGPKVSQLAQKFRSSGKECKIKFPRPYMRGTFEFSFSGVKTAVSYFLRDNKKFNKDEVCYAFEEAVVDTLIYKVLEAVKYYKIKAIAVGGGVSANKWLRKRLGEECDKRKIKLYFSEPMYCSDNAAMIALAGYKKFKKLGKKNFNIEINPNMIIDSWRD